MKMYCINHVFTEFFNSACENSATADLKRFIQCTDLHGTKVDSNTGEESQCEI